MLKFRIQVKIDLFDLKYGKIFLSGNFKIKIIIIIRDGKKNTNLMNFNSIKFIMIFF